MQTITIDIDTLRNIIKETVRDLIREERLNMMEALLPLVDKEEMEDIISQHGEEPGEGEFEEMTDWVKNED